MEFERLTDDGTGNNRGGNGGGGGGFSPPVPYLRVLRSVTAFVQKTYEMVDNFETDTIISWNSSGEGFIIWDAHKFAEEIPPCYFKHNKFSSFISQLNSYGFKKASWVRCEFHHEWFQKGKTCLLKIIKRKKNIRSARLVTAHDQEKLHQFHEEVNEMEKEIKEMQAEMKLIVMRVERLQEQHEVLEKLLAIMIKLAPGGLEEKRQRLHIMLMEQVEKAAGEMNKKILLDERPENMIGLDDLIEGGPIDWGNFMKLLGKLSS